MHLDLNLLTALDALLEEGTVIGAADRLHLSQPAMSRTLGRIRALTGDQILVRSGRTMTPTPYSLRVRDEVHHLVQQANLVLTPQGRHDLATLERTFSLQGHDALVSAIAPGLLLAVQREAPGITLRFLAETPVDNSDLRLGRIDLYLGATAPTAAELRHENLGSSNLVVALRGGHELLTNALTVDRYAAANHIVVSRRGRTSDDIDDALAELGLRRRVVATVPSSAPALLAVQASDAITAVAAGSLNLQIAALGIQTRPMPISLPALNAVCSWHQRYDGDPAHQWLRAAVRRTFQSLQARAGADHPLPPAA